MTVAALQADLDRRGLRRPAYGTAGLGAVMLGAAGALGIPVTTVDGETSTGSMKALGLPAAKRVCVILVDGLGMRLLTERRGHARTLRDLLPGARTLSAPFPSTTAAALGVLGTGTSPGRTGLLGYSIRSSATGQLANMLSWTNLPEPEQVQQEPTILEAAVAAGARATAVGLARFETSGMTRAALRGARYAAGPTLSARIDQAVDSLRTPGLTYLYVGEVDKAGHHYGWKSGEWGDALAEVDLEIGRLVRSVPRGTLVLVTADHGMVDVTGGSRWDVADEPELARGVAVVAGEPRATHLYVEPGVDPVEVQSRWQEVLGSHAVVALRDDGVAAGLFGPVHDRALPDVGDLVVIMAKNSVVVDSASQTPASIGLIGVHGSLTPDETKVPLLVATA